MKAGEKPKNHRIQWADSQDTAGCKQTFDGIPFQIIGVKILECQNGPDRNRVLKRKEAEKRMREDVSNQSNAGGLKGRRGDSVFLIPSIDKVSLSYTFYLKWYPIIFFKETSHSYHKDTLLGRSHNAKKPNVISQ